MIAPRDRPVGLAPGRVGVILHAMKTRIAFWSLSIGCLACGAFGLFGRFMDSNWPVGMAVPLALFAMGFLGVLALFLKDG